MVIHQQVHGLATSAVISEILDELRSLERSLVVHSEIGADEQSVAEAQRWIFSITQVAMECFVWADTAAPRFVDIVGASKKWGGDNADAFYQHVAIDPNRRYRVSGHCADAVYLSLTVYGGPDDGHYSERIVGSVNTHDLDIGPDGRFEFWIAPEPMPGPGILLAPDAVVAITRDYLADPSTQQRSVWQIEALDPAPPYRLTDEDLARRMSCALTWIRDQAAIVPVGPFGEPNTIAEPYEVPTTTFGWAAGDAAYAMGGFDLGDDEALVISGRSPDCAFWNLCLWNPLLHTYDYDRDRVTINGTQITYEADGSWTVVVSSEDPGHPNWVSTQGHRSGRIWLRWFLPAHTPEALHCEVVDRAEFATSARPAPVHIDDYRHPHIDPEIAEIMTVAGAMAESLPLEVDAIVAQAIGEVSGPDARIEDLGEHRRFGADTSFRDRMAVLLDAYRGEGGISRMGHVAVHTLFVQLCRNRLLIEDLLAQHPEINDIEITAPIVIAGLPRTGTTHLHNLLAADPALRSLPYWESCEPVPGVAERSGADPSMWSTDPGPRRDRAAMAMEFTNAALPYFRRMHEMDADHIHEEIQLLAIDFSSMFFETLAPVPTWRDHYLASDQVPHYRYLKLVLQVLTFLRGGDRWVLKSPQHLEQFRSLMEVFPDATVVVTHRDPVAVTASMVTMVAYTSRLQIGPVDPEAIGAYWVDRLDRMLGSALDDRDLLPADQSIDVRFDQFMSDDLGTVEAIYRLADQPLDERARAAHADYIASHGRARHGELVYDLADFGITVDDCAHRFGAYVERFL